MDVKTAIQVGDIQALKRLLGEDASRSNALIRWGRKGCLLTHPLHYVSDMLFEGTLQKGSELPLIDALIEAGADLNFQRDRDDGKRSDTPLIGAASLGAEDVGLRLLQAGANPELRGLFGETALHWASLLGEDRLVAALIKGSDLNLKDERYNSPPLGWAIHGCYNPPAGNHGRQREVVALLVRAGAMVESYWLESDDVRTDASMLAGPARGTASMKGAYSR
jgi:ankyrin repeat protein